VLSQNYYWTICNCQCKKDCLILSVNKILVVSIPDPTLDFSLPGEVGMSVTSCGRQMCKFDILGEYFQFVDSFKQELCRFVARKLAQIVAFCPSRATLCPDTWATKARLFHCKCVMTCPSRCKVGQVKWQTVPCPLEQCRRGAHPCSLGHELVGGLTTVAHGQCNARPTVTFPKCCRSWVSTTGFTTPENPGIWNCSWKY